MNQFKLIFNKYHKARDLYWSSAFPMGTALEGGEGGEFEGKGGESVEENA